MSKNRRSDGCPEMSRFMKQKTGELVRLWEQEGVMCGERYRVLGRYSMMARYLVEDFCLGCGEDGLL